MSGEARIVKETDELSDFEWSEGEIKYLLDEPDMVEILLMSDELAACRVWAAELGEAAKGANEREIEALKQIDKLERRELFLWGATGTSWFLTAIIIIFAL